MTNLFERTSSQWVRYSEYEWKAAEDGTLTRAADADALRQMLSVLKKEEEAPGSRFKLWKGRRKNGKKTDE